MKYLKLALISAAIFGLLFFAMSLLFPSQVVVSRAVDISKGSNDIYKKLKDIKGWKGWISELNNSAVMQITDTSLRTASTSILITAISQDKVISLWTNSTGSEQESTMRVITAPSQPNTTTVQWQFVEQISWYKPWEKFSSLVSDQILGTMMEQDLNNLKKVSEGN